MTTDDRQDPAEHKSPDRMYPIDRPAPGESDKRFSTGLLIDLARVLTSHGYPSATGLDLVELQTKLFGFLYAPTDPAVEAALASLAEARERAAAFQLDESRPAQARAANRAVDPLRRFDRVQDARDLLFGAVAHGDSAGGAAWVSLPGCDWPAGECAGHWPEEGR
jgi:hypothetical protein